MYIVNREGYLFSRVGDADSEEYEMVDNIPKLRYPSIIGNRFNVTEDGELFDCYLKVVIPTSFRIRYMTIILRRILVIDEEDNLYIKTGDEWLLQARNVDYVGISLARRLCYVSKGRLIVVRIDDLSLIVNQFELNEPIIGVVNNLLITATGVICASGECLLRMNSLGRINGMYTYAFNSYRFIGCAMTSLDESLDGRITMLEEVDGELSVRYMWYRLEDRESEPIKTLDNTIAGLLHQQCPWTDVIQVNKSAGLVNSDGLVVTFDGEGNVKRTRIPDYILQNSARVKSARSIVEY